MSPLTAGRLSGLLRRCAAAGALSPGAQLHAQALVAGRLRTPPWRPTSSSSTAAAGRSRAPARCSRECPRRPCMPATSSSPRRRPERPWRSSPASSPPGSAPTGTPSPPHSARAPSSGTRVLAPRSIASASHLGLFPNVVVSGALLDMYGKAGMLDDAVRVFDEMPERDAAVWNCMVTGYARAGKATEALQLFRRAQTEAVHMARDLRAVPSVLNACGKEGELMKGREIHGRMVRCLAFDSDAAVGNALVDMYAKCGFLDAARAVFSGMKVRNIVSWSTLISCYGVHGMGEEALRIYEEMVSRGVKPNSITFTSVLTSCSHSGLVTDGRRIFESMSKAHGVEPTADHYTCMVDLLGRAGAIEEAVGFIRKMPMEPCASVWGALLSACAMHNNVDVGEDCSLQAL
ncbi:hypothetical protein ACP70R_049638 [Stipagrostis hirtigluma subsp. patula]